jgi:hypothetical protein
MLHITRSNDSKSSKSAPRLQSAQQGVHQLRRQLLLLLLHCLAVVACLAPQARLVATPHLLLQLTGRLEAACLRVQCHSRDLQWQMRPAMLGSSCRQTARWHTGQHVAWTDRLLLLLLPQGNHLLLLCQRLSLL